MHIKCILIGKITKPTGTLVFHDSWHFLVLDTVEDGLGRNQKCQSSLETVSCPDKHQ